MAKKGKKRPPDARAAELRAGQTPYALPEFVRSSHPWIGEKSENSNQWDILVRCKVEGKDALERCLTYVNGTKEEAEMEAEIFRVACEIEGHADNWTSRKDRGEQPIDAGVISTLFMLVKMSQLSESIHIQRIHGP